jgi:hypothetical protein
MCNGTQQARVISRNSFESGLTLRIPAIKNLSCNEEKLFSRRSEMFLLHANRLKITVSDKQQNRISFQGRR